MSVAERIPTTHRGQLLTLTAAAAAWVTVYWVNGWLWDTVLYNGFGMAPDARLTLTFSKSVQKVFGNARPKFSTAVPGRWRTIDAHPLAFQPTGLGYGMGATVHVKLPAGVHLAEHTGGKLNRTLTWHIPRGSTTRLHELLAQLGYLPLDWQPASEPASDTLSAELAAAVSPPPGQFSWRYSKTPTELRSLRRHTSSMVFQGPRFLITSVL